jgi:hypothetical protein
MLKQLAALAVALAAFTAAEAAVPIGFVPDVPTNDPGGGGGVFTAADVVRYAAGLYSPAPVLTIPGNPMVDALEKMDKPGNWLFSVEATNNLGGALATPADPRDVIRRDSAATYSFFFCGAAVGVPDGSNVDAIYLEGGDTGNLIVSFDTPTTIGPATFKPADLVRFKPTGVPGCGAWTLGAPVLAFDASAAGVPPYANVVGADRIGGKIVLTFDVPTSIGAATFLPGTLASWDGVTFAPFDSLASWPLASVVDDFTAAANPGRIPPTLHVNKSIITPGDLTLVWSGSCSEGASDYGIYEGTIGSWFSHTTKDCHDNPPALTEEVTPAAGSDYYLVVPLNDAEEGSYGLATSGERPPGAAQCKPVQTLTVCPP